MYQLPQPFRKFQKAPEASERSQNLLEASESTRKLPKGFKKFIIGRGARVIHFNSHTFGV